MSEIPKVLTKRDTAFASLKISAFKQLGKDIADFGAGNYLWFQREK